MQETLDARSRASERLEEVAHEGVKSKQKKVCAFVYVF
jgi:hypothetical protein